MRIYLPFILIAITAFNEGFNQPNKPVVDFIIPQKADYVVINGKPTLYYEITVQCSPTNSISLKKIDVVDMHDDVIVLSLTENDLAKRFVKDEKLNNGSGIIYLEYIIENKSATSLEHRLEFDLTRSNQTISQRFISPSKLVTRKAPVVLGAPLRSGPWAAVYEPSWERGHRRVIYSISEKQRIPGRFAIDFIKMNGQGLYASGNENEIKNWYGYGDDVLAVADGVVASIRNDFKESLTISAHEKVSPENGSGNYVSLEIGNGRFVFYEHLKPGSIKIKSGQKVRKGDVIASLGFTGQSTGPHLHFHVANEDSPLGAEGIPFAFESFTAIGSYEDFGKFGKSPWIPENNSGLSERKDERPAPNCVIQF